MDRAPFILGAAASLDPDVDMSDYIPLVPVNKAPAKLVAPEDRRERSVQASWNYYPEIVELGGGEIKLLRDLDILPDGTYTYSQSDSMSTGYISSGTDWLSSSLLVRSRLRRWKSQDTDPGCYRHQWLCDQRVPLLLPAPRLQGQGVRKVVSRCQSSFLPFQSVRYRSRIQDLSC